MIDFILKVKQKFITDLGYKESVIFPGCPESVADGTYPMTIDGTEYNIKIVAGAICVEALQPKVSSVPVVNERLALLEALLETLPECGECPRIATFMSPDRDHYCDKHKFSGDIRLSYHNAILDLEAMELRNATTTDS